MAPDAKSKDCPWDPNVSSPSVCHKKVQPCSSGPEIGPMSRDFVPSCYCSERRLGPHGYYGERTQEPTGQLCYPAREGALLSLDYTVSALGKDHASFQTNQSTSQSLLGLYGILPLTNPFPRIVSWDCVPYSIRSLSQARLTDRPLSVILGPTAHASQ